MSSAPRLEIDLEKIEQNARRLVERLRPRGISVTGVSKATLGCLEVANAMLRAGVSDLGDARIENIEAMRQSRIGSRMCLIRSPMLSQARRVVSSADVSFNTETVVLKQLSLEAQKQHRTHGIILMVELGDLREGLMPDDLLGAAELTLSLPNLTLEGLGTNLACRSGAAPDKSNMAELSRLAALVEATFDITLGTVSGGNSANLQWAFGSRTPGRVSNLRLGESILLGREALERKAIDGLHTDAIKLVAEVIEAKDKPTLPTGKLNQNAFGLRPVMVDRGTISQAILAVGIQDIDPAGLDAGQDIEIIGCSSDHLIVSSPLKHLRVGDEVAFDLDYSALLRAMTSPFVTKAYKSACDERSVLRQIAC